MRGCGLEMDFRKKCVALLLLCCTGAALEIFAPDTHQITAGSAALIPCHYTVEKPPVDPTFFAAFWYFQGKQILSYNNQVETTDSRYSLSIEKALNGRVDLSISRTVLSDAGVYTCSVLYSPVKKMKDITVHIKALTAPPRLAISDETVVGNEERVLRCSVTGFYPENIVIKWFRGREMLKDVIMDGPRRNSDGTFSANSSVTIKVTEEDRERNFSCRVQHESLQEPLQKNFPLIHEDLNVKSENQNLPIILGIIAAVVVVLVVVPGIAYCIYKKRNGRPQNHDNTELREPPPANGALPDLQIGEITVPELIEDKMATLECTLYNYILGKHVVEWYEKRPGIDEVVAVYDPRILITTERDDAHTYKSKLCLTPVKRADHGKIYICRVQLPNSERTVQRSTEYLHVTGQGKKPSQPENQPEASDQRRDKEKVEEGDTQELREEDRGGVRSVNEPIHEEEKQKTPERVHKTSEKGTDPLVESDNQENTRAVNHGEEGLEDPSLPTKTDHLEEQKGNEETSHLINNPPNENGAEVEENSKETCDEETLLLNDTIEC